jgi:integrase
LQGLTYKSVGPGLALGYRHGKLAGKWVARLYTGGRSYRVEVLGVADDTAEADGITVLDFWQAADKARALSTGRHQAPTSAPYRVKDAIRDYLHHLEGRASHRDAELRLAAYAIPAFGDKPVGKLTSEQLKAWLRDIAKAPGRARTGRGAPQRHRRADPKDPERIRQRQLSANKILGQLKAALNLAFNEGKVESDRAWRRVKPYKGVARARARYLSTEEARRLINASDGDFRLLVQAALLTGCRYGELCRLKVGDFDNASATLFVGQSKSGRSRRVYLTAEGQAFFRELVIGCKGTEPMLRREWHPSQQLRPMDETCDRAKIVPRLSFHGLRHTYASLSAMGGVPLPVLAQNLGHSSTRMVEAYYGHLAPSYVAEAVRERAPQFGIEVQSNVRGLK